MLVYYTGICTITYIRISYDYFQDPVDDEEYESVCIPSHNEHPSQNIRVLRVTGGTHPPHVSRLHVFSSCSIVFWYMVYGTFAQLITEVTTLWIMKMAGSPVTRNTRHRISGCNTGYWRDITFQLQQIDVQKIHVLSGFSYYNHKYRHISALQGSYWL